MHMASMVMLAQVLPPPLQTGSTLHVHFAEPTGATVLPPMPPDPVPAEPPPLVAVKLLGVVGNDVHPTTTLATIVPTGAAKFRRTLLTGIARRDARSSSHTTHMAREGIVAVRGAVQEVD